MTAPPTNTYETYAAVGNLDDLSKNIYNVDPFDTPGLSSFDTTDATAVLHEWQTDTLDAAVATNYVEEGLDAVTDAVTATSRLSNTCQISDKVARVSGTQQAVMKAGRGDELAYQISKSAKALKTDMEMQIFANNAEVTGSSGTPRELGGIPAWLVSNIDEGSGAVTTSGGGNGARTAGATRDFNEEQLKSVLRKCWNNGGDPDKIFVGGAQKQKMSTFAGNATRTIDAGEQRLVAAIDVYKSDFGELQTMPNRYSDHSNSNGTAFILQSDMWAVSYLRQFQIHPLAKTGDSEREQILVEYTLEARNQKASGAVYDLGQ